MYPHEFDRIHELYGQNSNNPYPHHQFPAIPPGFIHPMFKTFKNPMKEKFLKESKSMNQKLEDFHQMFQNLASGLFEFSPFGIIPPSHPLYSRKKSIENLKTENSKLQKENLELRKKMEKLQKNTKQH
ncbi:MAG: hypothetical protein GWN01_15220 [Nitrosopumilaceae archaeon]|nr:hypothetical protein [Nitrosopumilaceae archaeon]NIU02194.1 hypothetical protein [Nitrosopumilaceae archaeon]NIU88666.1 hypothetical protein [Nitrosopumilaceae archaeon]NIV66816.1 hypothetical protein [Nitrosopumilaceae archaeon]NIX62795.1 hypothetical protein [Nitrosopumilaceae archaeon]